MLIGLSFTDGHGSHTKWFLFLCLFSTELFVPPDSIVPPVLSDSRISSALDLARKISVYSSRQKALIAGQDLQADPQIPLLRPRTPVQPYPHYPWQPKGECLSSTKVQGRDGRGVCPVQGHGRGVGEEFQHGGGRGVSSTKVQGKGG